GDLSVNVAMKRNLNFNLLVPRDRSGYFPTVDQVPLTTIKNSSEVGRLPYFETPVYWDVLLTNSITRYYGPPSQTPLRNNLIPDGTSNIQNWVYLGTTDPYGKYQAALNRTQILTMGETGFRTTMNFGSYATFNPSVNYGARKENADFPSSVSADAKLSQDRLLKRNSYQYINNNHNFRIGAPVLFLNVTYRKVEAYKSELPDQVVGKNRVNEGEFSLESYAFQDFEFSVRTIRDLRNFASDYNPQPTQKQRWYYTVARASGFFDFIEGFGNKKASLLERQRSFYAGIFVNNDFVYHTALGKSLSNNFTVAFQMGGFSLPFIRNFKNFEMGTTWYHVYTSPILDNYRFYIQTDMQVTKNFGVELELDSRVTQPWRYTDQMAQQGAYTSGQTSLQTPNNVYQPTGTVYQPTSFGQDVATGLGANGLQARQTTAFNINRFMFTAKLNLHNWEYRLGYSMDLRALPGGSSFDNQLTFYDQSVFFSINLININLGGDDSQQQQGSRSRLYRFRKRPLEVGERSSVSSQAQ
ncbi:MAG: LPS-assembly protein LptD, partial [Leptospira sp.]|nr:LPS-assembly protein LptD [Leptospira sp.]